MQSARDLGRAVPGVDHGDVHLVKFTAKSGPFGNIFIL